MVVLGVGEHIGAFFENIGCMPFPGRVADDMTDVGLRRREVRLRRIPGPHPARGANGVFLVEDRCKIFGILFGDVPQHMLNNQVNIERNKNAPPQRIGMKERGNVEMPGGQEGFDNAHKLRCKIFIRSRKAVIKFGKRFARRLEDKALQPEAFWQLFQIDFRDSAHICGAAKSRCEFRAYPPTWGWEELTFTVQVLSSAEECAGTYRPLVSDAAPTRAFPGAVRLKPETTGMLRQRRQKTALPPPRHQESATVALLRKSKKQPRKV